MNAENTSTKANSSLGEEKSVSKRSSRKEVIKGICAVVLPLVAMLFLCYNYAFPGEDVGMNVKGARILFEIPLPFMPDALGLNVILISATQVNSWVVIAYIAWICFWLTRRLRVIPTGKRQIFAEFIVEKATGLVQSNMGEKFRGFAPFIAAILGLSAFSSLTSLLGMYPPTADLNTILGWAILVFVMITFYKIKTGGIGGYLKGYTEPIAVLTPFNIISEFATPVSMGFRHFGNIASGSVISVLLYSGLATLSTVVLTQVPWLAILLAAAVVLLIIAKKKAKSAEQKRKTLVSLSVFLGVFSLLIALLALFMPDFPLFQIGIPAVLSIYFDLFSGCLQAFIFSMLTMLYIAAAADTEEA